MSTAREQQSWRAGTRQPGGQDVPISDDVRDEQATSAPRSERELTRDNDRADTDGPTEMREVRSADPELSPETNAMLTDELRDVVGSDHVRVPAERPHATEGEYPDRQSAGDYLNVHRFQIIRAAAITLTFAAIVALATGTWWLLPLAAGIHALGTMTVVFTIIRLTTETEHPAPEVAAAMAEDGVSSPDERFTEMVEEFSQERRHGATETVSPGFNDRTAPAGADTPTAAEQQSSAMTPTAAPSRPAGEGGTPDYLIWATAASLFILSIVLPAVSGGGWMWLLPAVMIPLIGGWVVMQWLYIRHPGEQIRGDRRALVGIGIGVGIAVAAFCAVVALAFQS